MSSRDASAGLLTITAPWLFVVFWSTGFIGAKYTLPFIEPLLLLFVRFLLALMILALLLLYYRPPTRLSLATRTHLVLSGLLVHGAYLGGVFVAIALGMPAGIIAILVGLQPLLTTALSPLFFSDKIRLTHWLGVVAGFIGIFLVLGDSSMAYRFDRSAILAGVIALLGITAGTIYQKRISQGIDILVIAWWQYLGTAVLFGLGFWFFEGGMAAIHSVIWRAELFFGLAWLVLVLSIGAILLLNTMIHHHAAHKVTAFFYLVPPLTAIEAYYLFDERLTLADLFGMLLVALGIFLVMRKAKTARSQDRITAD